MIGALVFIVIGYLAAGSAIAIVGELTENNTMANIGVWALVGLLILLAAALLVGCVVALI